jgi:hypothetical protein
MDSSYVPTIEEQEMLLSERYGSTCTNCEMVDVRNSDELALVPINHKLAENEKIETCILPLSTLMDVDNSITTDEYTVEITD